MKISGMGLAAVWAVVVGCVLAETPVMRIMPMGDSITWGYKVNGGYRAPLYDMLTNAGYRVEFTGSQTGNSKGMASPRHEGHCGIVTSNNYCPHWWGLLEGLENRFAQCAPPHVVLLHIGTNDGTVGGPEAIRAHGLANLSRLIDRIAELQPGADVIVSTVLDRDWHFNGTDTCNEAVTNWFNPRLPALVAGHAAKGQKVRFFDLNPYVPLRLQADGVHPNAEGYREMAKGWFTAITNLVPDPRAFRPDSRVDDVRPHVEMQVPGDVLAQAMLWVDSSARDSLDAAVSNGTTRVTRWRDVRETDAAHPRRMYAEARPLTFDDGRKGALPELRSEEGVTALWFGGVTSGASMDWRLPDGTLFDARSICHVFAAHGVKRSWGFLFGWSNGATLTGDDVDFLVRTYGTPDAWGSYWEPRDPCKDMKVYENGVPVDPAKTRPKAGWSVLDAEAGKSPFRLNDFFNDRNCFTKPESYYRYRAGGDWLAEAVVFTNRLTRGERVAVQRYLMEKWLPARQLAAAAKPAAAATPSGKARVMPVQIPSASMGRNIPGAVVLPSGYDAQPNRRWPVVYCLHGAGDTWRLFTEVEWTRLADEHGFIVVCPDGAYTSWWFDSPVDPKMRYETHVSKEAVAWVDAHYRTVADRKHRAIMGNSMGGHGACWIGFRHRDVFGAVGSIFGGMDLRPFPNNWDIAKRLGPLAENHEVWRTHSVVTAAEDLKNGDIDFLAVIGTQDFFLDVNRALHRQLAERKVAHTYVEIRGSDEPHSTHNHAFRRDVLPILARYFHAFFAEGRGRL